MTMSSIGNTFKSGFKHLLVWGVGLGTMLVAQAGNPAPTYDNESFWQHSSDMTEINRNNPNADHCNRPGVWRYEWDAAGNNDLTAATARKLMTWNTANGWWSNGNTMAIIASDMAHPELGMGTDLTWIAPDVLGKGKEVRVICKYNRREGGGKGTGVAIYKLSSGKMEKIWSKTLAPLQKAEYDSTMMIKSRDQLVFRVTPVENDIACGTVEINPLICIDSKETPAKVEFVADTSGVSDKDSLHNVFPEIDSRCLAEGRIPPSIVDENSAFNNMILLIHNYGPVYITWDLGQGRPLAGKAQLNSLSLWLSAGGDGNFCGQLSTSVDGKTFTKIPGTFVRKEFPIGKNPDAGWSLNPEDLKDQNKKGGYHLIRYHFEPGQVVGFRYLRIESFGYSGQPCRLKKVNADISGVNIRKSTDVYTELTPLPGDKIVKPVIADQAVYPPLKAYAVKFFGGQLVLSDSGRALLNLKEVINPGSANGKMLERKESERHIQTVFRQNNGFIRTCKMDIDPNNLVKMAISWTVPADTASLIFTTENVQFHEAKVAFDGVTYGCGSGPVFLSRMEPSTQPIANGYLIFPSQKDGFELQMFMPNSYDQKGRTYSYYPSTDIVKWELFNSVTMKDGKAIPNEIILKSKESFQFNLNLGVLAISPRTLGAKDIEASKANFEPMVGVEMGIPGRGVPGQPRVIERAKMLFMGFKLPEPIKEKAGHQISIWHTWKDQGGNTIERFKRCGIGIILLHSEYVDVSHGVSFNGKYDQEPPGFKELLAKIKANGMDTVMWYSPRGFLQEAWIGRPKDVIVEQHPDWFLNESHWFGKYRTMSPFSVGGNEWNIAKFKSDLNNYPDLNGFGADSFASNTSAIGCPGNPRLTMARQELIWTEKYSKVIHNTGNGKIFFANYSSPLSGEMNLYDYAIAEHPPLMYMNEVTGGRSLGSTFRVYTRWTQLYFWYVVLAHMYHNFCDYDQPLGWIGPGGLAILDGQEAPVKNIDAEIAPIWYLMGKGNRVYGAEIAPKVRQIEAKMPDGSMRVILCSMSNQPTDLNFAPQKVPAGTYNIEVTVDTATKKQVLYYGKFDCRNHAGFEVKQLPPYSIMMFNFPASAK